jgi:nucleotide-binding universal stress UspA family protein
LTNVVVPGSSFQMPRFRTILYPSDFSETSAQAFANACDLARDHGARLVVLHVLEPMPPLIAAGVLLPTEAGSTRSAARDRLVAVRPDGRDIPCERLLRDGPAAETIVAVAHEIAADLIVMGTHGRTGLSRLLLSSVAESVLREAACPVLFVKVQRPRPTGGADSVERGRAADDLAGI